MDLKVKIIIGIIKFIKIVLIDFFIKFFFFSVVCNKNIFNIIFIYIYDEITDDIIIDINIIIDFITIDCKINIFGKNPSSGGIPLIDSIIIIIFIFCSLLIDFIWFMYIILLFLNIFIIMIFNVE